MKTREEIEAKINSLREQRREVVRVIEVAEERKDDYLAETYKGIRANLAAQIATLFWVLDGEK